MDTFEPPKYLASLISAINDGTETAQTGAFAFALVEPISGHRVFCERQGSVAGPHAGDRASWHARSGDGLLRHDADPVRGAARVHADPI